jgi:hypothetical protein
VWPTTPNADCGGGLDCVGEQWHTEALKAIAGDLMLWSGVAVLLPEPDNEFDSTAVGIYINGQRVAFLPKDAPYKTAKFLAMLHQGIAAHGCVALEADIFHMGVVLEASRRPMSRVAIAKVLTAAGFTHRVGDGEGFSVSEQANQAKVFHAGSEDKRRREMVPKYAKALKDAGYSAKATREEVYGRDEVYQYVTVSKPPQRP